MQQRRFWCALARSIGVACIGLGAAPLGVRAQAPHRSARDSDVVIVYRVAGERSPELVLRVDFLEGARVPWTLVRAGGSPTGPVESSAELPVDTVGALRGRVLLLNSRGDSLAAVPFKFDLQPAWQYSIVAWVGLGDPRLADVRPYCAMPITAAPRRTQWMPPDSIYVGTKAMSRAAIC